MKPAQIRVFDGLRITTEHVNHLQGALYSGLEDFREIFGLGQVQLGFDVAAQDDGSVTIQPGLAFDLQKNRLTSDDPQTVKVNFGSQDSVKYICVKYEQVADEPVEGHPTMIWDSCSVVVRSARPDPKENLVVLAIATQTPDGKLQVCSVEEECVPADSPSEAEIPESQGPASPPDGPGNDAPQIPDSSPAPSEPTGTGTAAPQTEVPAQPQPTSSAPASSSAAPLIVSLAPALPPANGVQLRQGIIHLASDPGAGPYLKTVLAPALRKKLGSDSINLSFILAQADLNPDITVSGFSTQCLLTGDFTCPAGADTPPSRFHFQCAASGEAIASADGITQFGTSTLLVHPLPPQSGSLWSAADFTSQGILMFMLARWADAPEVARPPLAADFLAATQLSVQIDPGNRGFQISLKLSWNGKVSEESVRELETQDIGFAWDTSVAWKAIGK